MTLMGGLAIGGVAGWLLSTVAAQVPSRISALIGRADVFHLVPRWTFFAPTPGSVDYHLIYRTRNGAAEPTGWRVVRLVDRPSPVPWLWHPDKRHRKVMNDAVQGLQQLRHGGFPTADELQFSIPYLMMLTAAMTDAPSGLDDAELQFGVVETSGHSERTIRPSFLSNYHRISLR